MIYAVDFDGTLFRTEYPAIKEPNKLLIELLKELRTRGCKVILWTCREGKELEEAVAKCAEYGLAFDAINDNIEEGKKKWGNNPRKVYADFYIDDHNWQFNIYNF